jgi:hypothetical protein
MALVPKHRKKKSPVILATPAPVLLVAAAPTPVPLVAALAPVPLPAMPAPVPAVVVTALPLAPVPLVPVVVARVPPQARAPTQVEVIEPIHPLGILGKIVGTEMTCQGRSCKEHKMCGEVLKEDVGVCRRKMQLVVEGKEEMTIAAIWVVDGIDRCCIGFVPRHMVRHAMRYDMALVQVTCIFREIWRSATWRSIACFLRTKDFALHQSSLPCRNGSKM